MNSHDAQTQATPIFASESTARSFLMRAVLLGGAALLVGWLVALALGAMGGFESLPGLPGAEPTEVSRASAGDEPSEALKQRATAQSSTPVATEPAHAPAAPNAPVAARPKPVAARPKPVSPAPAKPAPPATAPAPTQTSKSQGQGSGVIKPQGKPADSPGNGGGGTGPPGQLR